MRSIKTGELPTPEPGLRQVRVRLEASGVNPSDTYRRRGAVPAEYPRVIPNSDGAGVVDKVGEGVDPEWVGKRVWLYNGQRNGRWMGTAAEFIALDVDLVTELPGPCLVRRGGHAGHPRHDGAWLRLCLGAGPGTDRCWSPAAPERSGHYAVQLAAWAGARVIATVSSEAKAARARQGGAEFVVNYRTEDVAARRGRHHRRAWASTTSSTLISAATWRRRWRSCGELAASPTTRPTVRWSRRSTCGR